MSIPVKGLLDPAYLARRSALISAEPHAGDIEPGIPAGAPPRVRAPFKNDPGTSDLAVVDGKGNVVEVTTTINGYFGSGVAVDGFMINNELPDFDQVPVKDGYLVANRVEGGKRPRSSMSPIIVYGPDGKVRARARRGGRRDHHLPGRQGAYRGDRLEDEPAGCDRHGADLRAGQRPRRSSRAPSSRRCSPRCRRSGENVQDRAARPEGERSRIGRRQMGRRAPIRAAKAWRWTRTVMSPSLSGGNELNGAHE